MTLAPGRQYRVVVQISGAAMWVGRGRPARRVLMTLCPALPWDACRCGSAGAPMASVVDGENVFDVELSLESDPRSASGAAGRCQDGRQQVALSRAGAGRCSTGSASSGGGGADDMKVHLQSAVAQGCRPASAARAHVRLERQRLRGETWYLLRDEASGRIHRVNASAYAFVGRCDGRHSVAELWEVLRIELGEQMPTERNPVAARPAFEGSLLEFEHSPDLRACSVAAKGRTPAQDRNANPFSFRISLGDPSRLLARLSFLAPLLFSWPALCLLAAGGRRGARRGRSQRTGNRRGGVPVRLQPSSLILLWISYPLIKAVLSSPTASRVRRWGGQVGAFGVALCC